MKHLNNMACMLALLAAGSTGFTACSSDDAIDGGGNNTNGAAGKMVKTSFALNIPYGTKSTRMTEEITQAGGNNFRGMQDMRLLAFDKEVVVGNNAIKKIVLGTSDQAFEADQYRRIYRDVTIPVGTKNFLFYGKTDGTFTETGDALMTARFTNGVINEADVLTSSSSGTTNPDNIQISGITFSLEPIYRAETYDVSSANASAKVIAEQLKKVYTTTYGDDNKKWSDCSLTDANATVAEIHAATLFAQFKDLKAGSAASVIATLNSLKKSCGRDITSDTETKDVLYAVAKACDDAVKAIGTNTFPRDLGLPDGAAKGDFGNDGTFAFASASSSAIGNNGLNFSKVTYPASLNYYVNTPVKANDKVIDNLNVSNGWPTYDNWKTGTDDIWSSDWGNAVTNNTRSIALKNAIQYAVASLETTVDIKGNATILEDNAKEVGKLLSNQQIPVNGENGGFELTGVLVGGQPSKVGWDYTTSTVAASQGEATPTYDYTVYDREMNQKSVKSSLSAKNYTLLLENSGAGDNKSVYITIELKNKTGVDFYGVDGIIPADGTFYLVGQLNPSATSGVQKPTGETINDVFLKDHKTIANLHISSLKSAYNTIPDLRSTQISLGLAVDLTWQNGITFNVDL